MMERFAAVRPADPGETTWSRMVFVSLGLHVAGFVLAVGLPRLVPRAAASPVYVVDLVSLPGGPANAAAPPPAAAAAPPVAPKTKLPPPPPKEEKAIKIPDKDKKVEPKKTPAPKATPKPVPTTTPAAAAVAKTTPAEAAATPSTPQPTPAQGASMSGVSGGAGQTGGGFGGTGSAQADALTYYASLVQRNIENAWKKPIYPPAETSRRAFTTQIRLTLTSSGRVSKVDITVPSGYDAMDRSVLDAVHDAVFPPFPSSLGYASLPLTVEIVLTRD